MYPVKRLLVALDLSEMDQKLIAYTSTLVALFDIEIVYFLHVAKKLELSDALIKQFPGLLSPVDEEIEKRIQDNINKYFAVKCDYKIEVREGNAENKVLRWADLKEIDLVIMGRKLELKGTGLLPGKLARTIHCSILLVPETDTQKISRIMVSVDFSAASTLALEEALIIKKASGAELIVQNSYEVPSGYHLSGKSYEEFAEIMKGNTYEDLVNFIEKSKVRVSDVEIVLTLDEEDDPAERAYEVARKENIDLIIIGSKGRKEIAALILGSVAEKIIRYDTNIPVLVVKDKEENLGFLQALLRV